MQDIEATEGYEISGIRAICPEHGFQKKVKTMPVDDTDIFGFYNTFGFFCQICGKECKIEKLVEVI
jgi:hypothetical protein